MSMEKHMNTLIEAKRHDRQGAVTAMGVGLLLTVVTLIAVIIDQRNVGSLALHVHALYAPYELHPDPDVLFGYLYVTALIGILLWVMTIWGVRQGKPGARVVTTTVFVCGASLALFNLVVSEYGTQIFPTPWGILGLAPSVAGLVAVVLLWMTDPAKLES